MDGMDEIFKLATSPSSMSLLSLSNFKFQGKLRTIVTDLEGIIVIFKLATLD